MNGIERDDREREWKLYNKEVAQQNRNRTQRYGEPREEVYGRKGKEETRKGTDGLKQRVSIKL